MSLDLLKGLWSYGVLNLITGSDYPQIFSAPNSETVRKIPKSFEGRRKNALKVLYHPAKFDRAQISPAAEAAKNVEYFCLSACLFVRHAFERQRLCARFLHESVEVHK